MTAASSASPPAAPIGHAVGKSLAFAYVEPALATSAGEFAVELHGERHAARIIPEAGL